MPDTGTAAALRAARRAAGLLLLSVILAGCSAAPAPDVSSAAAPPGSPSATGALALVALGDSIVTGGETGGDDGYPQRYADLVAKTIGRAVELTDLADPSETSGTLLEKVRSDDDLRTTVARADIVTITVGGNDGDPFADHDVSACAPGSDGRHCLAGYAPALATNLDGILTEIEHLRNGAPTAIRLTSPDYDPFIGVSRIAGAPSFPRDFGLAYYRQVAAAMTETACRAAAAHHAECADFFHVFNGPRGDQPATAYLADDHLHPSARGRAAIADTLASAGLRPVD